MIWDWLMGIDWSSWVQAIGSIAAIGVSIWVSDKQATASREERDIDRKDAERHRTEEFDRQCRARDREVREQAEEKLKFVRYVYDRITNGEKRLSSEVQTLVSLRDHDDAPYYDPVGHTQSAHSAFANSIVRPLRRIAELPMSYWPDPHMASEFQQGVYYLETDLRKLDEVVKVAVAPTKEAHIIQFGNMIEELERVNKNLPHRFGLFKPIAEAYLQDGEEHQMDDRYPFYWDAIRALVEEDERKNAWMHEGTREELEAEYDYLNQQHGLRPYVPDDDDDLSDVVR